MLEPIKRSIRPLLDLALPVIIVQIGLRTMGIVDAIMVGHISAIDLAAVALGDFYFFSISVFGMGTLMALDPIISQAYGAGDRAGLARGVQRGILLAVVIGMITGALLITAGPVLTLLKQPPEVVPIAASYALASIAGTIPFQLFVALRQVLQAIGRIRPIVIMIVLANVANALLNWIFIFGNLGVPQMGAVGSGWASSIARWLLALGLLATAWPVLKEHLRPIAPDVLSFAPIKRMLGIGAPIGVQMQVEFGAFGLIAVMMGVLGPQQVASHQIAITLASLTFMVPVGFAAAGAVLVGQAIGKADMFAARGAAGASILAGAVFMAFSAAAMVAIPGIFAGVYTTDPVVLGIAASLIPIAGVFQVFDGIQVVSVGVLRGLGDTRAPMLIGLFGFWLLGIPTSLYLGFARDMGPRGLWWGLVVGLGTVSIFLLARVRSQFGRDIKRVAID